MDLARTQEVDLKIDIYFVLPLILVMSGYIYIFHLQEKTHLKSIVKVGNKFHFRS